MKFLKKIPTYCILIVFFVGFTSNSDARRTAFENDKTKEWQQVGWACIYSKGLDGGQTASGKKLDLDALTAAHKTLALGSKVKVTNLDNGKSVVVKITDRGPYSKKFIIDMTPAAAKKIGFSYSEGITKVRLTKV